MEHVCPFSPPSPIISRLFNNKKGGTFPDMKPVAEGGTRANLWEMRHMDYGLLQKQLTGQLQTWEMGR